MSDEEILADRRFRLSVHKGEYSRAVTLFLRMKHPFVDDLTKPPKAALETAQVRVDNAFIQKWQREKDMAKEMR